MNHGGSTSISTDFNLRKIPKENNKGKYLYSKLPNEDNYNFNITNIFIGNIIIIINKLFS